MSAVIGTDGIEVLFGERVHAVPCGGVQAVVREQRVVRDGGEADAVAVKDRAVELHVMADEGLGRVCEEGTEDVDLVRRHVPRLAGCGRKGEADELAEVGLGRFVSVLRRGGLRVEGDAVRLHQLRQQRLRLLLGPHKLVVMRKG